MGTAPFTSLALSIFFTVSALSLMACNVPTDANLSSISGGFSPEFGSGLFSYLEDSTGHLWVCAFSSWDGSLKNCTSSGDSNHWNPEGTMTFARVNGVSYGYVSDTNGLIWSCTLDSKTGLTTHCNLNGVGAVQPQGVRVLELGGSYYGYVADGGSGNLFICSVNPATGAFQGTCSRYNPNGWAANDINFVTLGSNTYAYVASLAGSIFKCQVNSVDGQLSNCVSTNGGFQWDSPFQLALQSIGNTTYAFVADLNRGFVTCEIDGASGVLTDCELNRTGVGGSYPSSIAFTSVAGQLTALLTTSDAYTWLCPVDTQDGSISDCSMNGGTWNSNSSIQGMSNYRP